MIIVYFSVLSQGHWKKYYEWSDIIRVDNQTKLEDTA